MLKQKVLKRVLIRLHVDLFCVTLKVGLNESCIGEGVHVSDPVFS